MKSSSISLLTFGFMISGLAIVHSSEKKLEPTLEDSDLYVSKRYATDVSLQSLDEDEKRRKELKDIEDAEFNEAVKLSLESSVSSTPTSGSSSDPLPLSSTKTDEGATVTRVEEDEPISDEIIQESIKAERQRRLSELDHQEQINSAMSNSLWDERMKLIDERFKLHGIDPLPVNASSSSSVSSAQPQIPSDASDLSTKSRTPSVHASSLQPLPSASLLPLAGANETKSDDSKGSTSDGTPTKK